MYLLTRHSQRLVTPRFVAADAHGLILVEHTKCTAALAQLEEQLVYTQ